MKMKLGLKLWSTNLGYIDVARKLYQRGVCDYIELYVVPGTAEYLNQWHELQAEVPWIIHAPHSEHGFNLSLAEQRESNLQMAEEVSQYCSRLKSPYVIFHGGTVGEVSQTIKQLIELQQKVNLPTILIENKPYWSVRHKICIGSKPQEVRQIMTEAEVEFCLDIGHAICAANYYQQDRIEFLKSMQVLNPTLYHLSDGDWASSHDSHENLGKGNYPFEQIVKLLDQSNSLTIETDKISADHLDDFTADVNFLRSLL